MTATLSFKYFDDIEGCAWQDVVVGDDYAHVLHIAVSAFDPFQYRSFQLPLNLVAKALFGANYGMSGGQMAKILSSQR